MGGLIKICAKAWLFCILYTYVFASKKTNKKSAQYSSFTPRAYGKIRIRISVIFGVVSGSGSALEWKAGSGSAFKSKFRSLKAQNRAVEGHGRSQLKHGGSEWSSGESVDQWTRTRITLKRIRIRIHLEEDPDPDPHRSEKLDPDPHWSEKLYRSQHLSDADPQHWKY